MMDELIDSIIEFRDERNWKPFHNPKDLALSITLEASELLELFQWKSGQEAIDQHYADMQDEIADILIYTLTLAHDLDIDVKAAILEKMRKNAIKYPADRTRDHSNQYTSLDE
ncbi:nucleotide pyrophosphohydrolase [Paenibacillus sp. F411]|nr:nucleotide pyrophosphohydrolase [Paenibacillus sp. F411]